MLAKAELKKMFLEANVDAKVSCRPSTNWLIVVTTRYVMTCGACSHSESSSFVAAHASNLPLLGAQIGLNLVRHSLLTHSKSCEFFVSEDLAASISHLQGMVARYRATSQRNAQRTSMLLLRLITAVK